MFQHFDTCINKKPYRTCSGLMFCLKRPGFFTAVRRSHSAGDTPDFYGGRRRRRGRERPALQSGEINFSPPHNTHPHSPHSSTSSVASPVTHRSSASFLYCLCSFMRRPHTVRFTLCLLLRLHCCSGAIATARLLSSSIAVCFSSTGKKTTTVRCTTEFFRMTQDVILDY